MAELQYSTWRVSHSILYNVIAALELYVDAVTKNELPRVAVIARQVLGVDHIALQEAIGLASDMRVELADLPSPESTSDVITSREHSYILAAALLLLTNRLACGQRREVLTSGAVHVVVDSADTAYRILGSIRQGSNWQTTRWTRLNNLDQKLSRPILCHVLASGKSF